MGFSERYHNEVKALESWFYPLLVGKRVASTYDIRVYGVDKMPPEYIAMTKKAFDVWLEHREYEVSYAQMCAGFFAAANRAGLWGESGERDPVKTTGRNAK